MSTFTHWSIQAWHRIVTPPFLCPDPKSTMHHQSMQHYFLINSPWWCQSKSILVAYICFVMTNAVSSLYKQGHLNPQMLVFSAFEDCRVVAFLINRVVASMCVTHTILWFETSPSIRILNFCRDVLRSYEHNLRRFLLQFQPRWSWYGQPFNYSH